MPKQTSGKAVWRRQVWRDEGLEADCRRSCFTSVMFIPMRKNRHKLVARNGADAMGFVCREQVRVGLGIADAGPMSVRGQSRPLPISGRRLLSAE
jgi:hypothetical protein